MTRTMSDKQKRAINAGRKRAGLKPIKWKSKAGKKSLSAFKKAGYTQVDLEPICFHFGLCEFL